MKTTVLLVDDHTVVRQGLRALLQSQPDFEVVGEAENGRDAISLAAQLQPQVVLMDVAMPSQWARCHPPYIEGGTPSQGACVERVQRR